MSKQTLMQSYIAGIRDTSVGEKYTTILTYFVPEFITALLLSSVLNFLDAWFIADLQSTSLYATQGISSTLTHFITKIAEGVSIGTVILCGQYNGLGKMQNVGKAAISALWITCIMGLCVTCALFFGASWIYSFFHMTPKMLQHGVSFLRLRSLSVFFAFMFFALIGFLRGIKNTRVPMMLFIIGGVIFIFFDYALIFGKWGFPELQLKGSAIASLIQYIVMFCGACCYLIFDKHNRLYSMHIIKSFDVREGLNILWFSLPVMADKAILAAAKIWLGHLISPMGKMVTASFTVIKDIEQLAFIPAIAFAQVITFLVSNDYARHNWAGIKANIKKVIFLSSLIVFTVLLIFSLFPATLVQLFDKKGTFIVFASMAIPYVSVLVFFDLLQLILAGALRGAANVKMVMLIRLIVCVGFFVPTSYLCSSLPISQPILKFILVYGSFYVSNGLMSIMYIYRFRSNAWKQYSQIPVKDNHEQNYQGRNTKTRPHISDQGT
ncbi:MAG: MATE family efflux transporter [Candidatus Babeliaceae bacterium]